jgi:methanethiol S-methyltransferase
MQSRFNLTIRSFARFCDLGASKASFKMRSFAATVARPCGVVFGVATQGLFLYTVVHLFLFLRYGGLHSSQHWLVKDILLSIGFAVPHSVLLAPPIQKRIKRWLAPGLIGCLHCSVTCITLLVMFRNWGSSNSFIWHATGIAESAILVGFYGSWAALLYSLYITGMGYQTGLTQWWYWLQNKQPPRREFVESGAYRIMRHPIYMSFLGLIWFTPTMTFDHAVLTTVWTAYIYAGSYFKDKRMIHFVGPQYREYASRVAGLPIIGFGPLRKMKVE